MKHFYFLLCMTVLHNACTGQNNQQRAVQNNNAASLTTNDWQATAYMQPADPDSALQVSTYIPSLLQDRAGNIWIGTNGDGVCLYNARAGSREGQTLRYFNTQEGFGGTGVREIMEDESGVLWFATTGGVTRYDRKQFTNYTTSDGLRSQQVWSIAKDKNGVLWFGTDDGVSRFDASRPGGTGKKFTDFELPAADLTNYPNSYPAPKLVNFMFRDAKGDLWLATNGLGVYRYDGKTLTNISEKDGLCHNIIQCIIQDRKGHLWFCSSFGGVSRFEGGHLTNFTMKEGMSGNSVWTALADKEGNIWLATGQGVDRYDGKTFTNFSKKDGLMNRFVQSMLEDADGNLWFGTSGGVYRLIGERFVNFTKQGLMK